jgi:light-regulated signal transduction histidine kinase (bacteriophytochrome)
MTAEVERRRQIERWIAWVRLFAEAHGGTLDVRSDPGSGATFTIRLPIG